MKPGPHTIIAAGQTQAPGFGCAITSRIPKNLGMHKPLRSRERPKNCSQFVQGKCSHTDYALAHMTREARLMSGIILITIPTIQYGGYFLLTSLMNKNSGYMENPLRQNFFRAGHAHAGVIVLLSLVCQMLADSAALPISLLWFVRVGVPFAAVLISAGFFFSVLPPTATQPNGAVSLIYLGAVVLAVAVVSLGIGLVKAV